VFNVDTIVHKEYVEQSFTGNCVEYISLNSKQVSFLLGLLLILNNAYKQSSFY